MSKANMATEATLLSEVLEHYSRGYEETDTRATRHNGFDDIDEIIFGKLPENWPYQTMVTDNRGRTALLEKTSRLFANPIKGRVNPREGGDSIGAMMHNAILDFQIQNEPGGSWLEKWAMIDHYARRYGAGFWGDKWRYETRVVEDGKDKKGKKKYVRELVCDQSEMVFYSNRDVAVDPTASTIGEARWVQVREWVTLEELERVNDAASSSPIYQNLSQLREKMSEDDDGKGVTRSTERTNKTKILRGLDDTYQDSAFPEILIVTEYRRDRWITFAADYELIIRNIANPYDHGEIPIDMLKYYPVDDDLYGEPELEPVMSILRAINALICATYDEINTKLYTPLKVRSTGVQIDTLEYGPDALWMMNDPNTDVVPHQVTAQTLNHFQTMYTVLVQSFQYAMGELSQGVSNIDMTKSDKTATEIQAVTKQQNARDNYNQLYLSEAIKRQMMRRISMNKQFIFSDPSKVFHILRIAGKDALDYFRRKGMGEMELTPEAAAEVASIIAEREAMGISVSDQEMSDLVESLLTPRYPVEMEEGLYTSKLVEDEGEDGARLIIEQEDLEGDYEYVADVQSMELGRGDQEKVGRAQAFAFLFGNDKVNAMLTAEGKKFKAVDTMVQYFEDLGLKNAENLFEDASPQQAQQIAGGAIPGGADPAQAGAGGGSPLGATGMAGGGSPAPTIAPPGPGGPAGSGGIPGQLPV